MPTDINAAPETGGGGAGGALTRKLGPLPVWGWAIVVAGGVLVARHLGGKAATGGQSFPGTTGGGGGDSMPPIGAGGDTGLGGGTPGPQGLPGPAGPPGSGGVPSAYTGQLNGLFDWFQELNRTAIIIDTLRAKQYASTSTTEKASIAKVLTQLTGSGTGKVTYNGSTYYSRGFLTTTINTLQGKLGAP